VKRVAAIHEVPFDLIAVDIDGFHVARFNLSHELTEVQGAIGLGLSLLDYSPQECRDADQNYPEN